VLKQAGSILAIHPGAMGDVILFGHLLGALGGPVTLVAGKEKATLLAGLGVAKRAVDFNALPMHEVFASGPATGDLSARLGRHERLVSCFASGNLQAEATLAALCGAASATFLPVRPPEGFPGHLLDLWTNLLGMPVLSRYPAPWPVPKELQHIASKVLTENGVDLAKPYVAVHPGAGAAAKCWPLEQFIELADLLRRRGLAVVWILGPVEQERWPADKVETLKEAGLLLPPPDLAALAGVLAGAAGFVGNDSGPAHLAAAVGTATVVVATSVSTRHFAPLGPRVATVTAQTLEAISPQSVEQSLAGLAAGR
jgi:ADP-heptose:LPS heptosyltransferase